MLASFIGIGSLNSHVSDVQPRVCVSLSFRRSFTPLFNSTGGMPVATAALRQLESSPITLASGNIPFLDLKGQFAEIRDEVLGGVHRVLESQHFILGPEVDAFEREVAEYVGVEFAIGCGSGSDALLLAQMAIGIGPEDEGITPPFTFGAP